MVKIEPGASRVLGNGSTELHCQNSQEEIFTQAHGFKRSRSIEKSTEADLYKYGQPILSKDESDSIETGYSC